MKKIFNNLKIAILFALTCSTHFPNQEQIILSDDPEKDIKKLKEPFLVVIRGNDKSEYKDVTAIKHKFDDGIETVNVFSQAYIKKIAGDKAIFLTDGAYGFALINPKAKPEKPKEPDKSENKETGKDEGKEPDKTDKNKTGK